MLTISRQDIVGEYLQDFSEQSRYLKLPVDGYMDLLGIEPNSYKMLLLMQSIIQNIVLYVQLSLVDKVRLTLQILLDN